jgi:anti-anti-sigma factor
MEPVAGTGERVAWSPAVHNMRYTRARSGGRTFIRVAGELDLASVAVLTEALPGPENCAGHVVLDLARVTFCGTAGVALLLALAAEVRAEGGTLAAEGVHSSVLRAMELSGDPRAQRLARTWAPAPMAHQGRNKAFMAQALAAALRVTGAPMGNAQLVDPATGVLRIVVQQGFRRPFLSFFETVDDRDSACGAAAQDRQGIYVPEVAASPVFAGTPALEVLGEAGVGAVVSVPVLTPSGLLIGVLSTHHHRPTFCSLDQRRELEHLARAAGRLVLPPR